MTHLLLTALVRSLAEVTGLKIAGRRVLWDDQQFQRENAAGTRCHVFQSVVLTLRKVGASQHLLISPTLLVRSESGEMLGFEAEKQVKQRLLGYQHNNKFNQAVNFLATPSSQAVRQRLSFLAEWHPASAITCRGADLRRNRRPPTAAGRCGPQDRAHRATIGGSAGRARTHICSRRNVSTIVKDTHPIRGVLENRPYDYSLTHPAWPIR